MKKFLSILTVLLFVFAIGTHFVQAADIGATITYSLSGSTVGTTPGTGALAVFTPTTAIVGGHSIVLTFPTGTVLDESAIVKADFTIIEAGGGGVATAPIAVEASAASRTITLYVHPTSLNTGLGEFTINLSATALGDEITHPTATTTTGTFVVTTEAGDTGTISNVSFVADDLHHYNVVTENAGTEAAGTGFYVTITARDQYDNITTLNTAGGALGTENFSISTTATTQDGNDPTYNAGALPATPVALNISSGTVATNDFIFYNAGETPTITVGSSSTAAVGGTTAAITVNPDTADHVTLTSVPTIGYIYQAFATQPVVEIRDQYENVRTADTDNVVISACSDAACATPIVTDFTGTKTKAAVAGVATFTGISYDTVRVAGLYLKAAKGALTDCSSLFKIYGSPDSSTVTYSTTETTTTTAPQAVTTTTTAPETTTTTTSTNVIPQPEKPIAEMNQAEKNTYTMQLQQFLIQLLTQLLSLLAK
ncbi:MAG: hypothetical protein PHW83_09590 [Bacteroidales bacterium]|nr:hypothetical protein [Bacteroidales bacterium]